MAVPQFNALNSVYSYLPWWVMGIAIFAGVIQFPLAMMLEGVRSWKLYAYLLALPFFLISWWPITFYAFFTQNNKQWSHTEHSRVIRLEEVQNKQL